MTRLLIVDDEEPIRKMLSQTFKRQGFDVSDASNGRIAIDRQRKTPAHLIIIDLIMPEMEGIETIRKLKSEFPDVKIIAITGGERTSGEDNLKMAKMLGAERTFTKPIESERLKKAVNELVGEPSNRERAMEIESVVQVPPIDMSELLEIMDGNKSLIIDCFKDFLETYPDYLKDIEAAIASGNAIMLDESAHKFKGALKYLAAKSTAAIAFQIELMGKKNNLTHAQETFEALMEECEKVKTFVIGQMDFKE